MAGSRKLRVLVTGGPTRAPLDDFRYLSNHSSGALAFEICRRLKAAGAEVYLVSGPCPAPFGSLRLKKWTPVETVGEMRDSVVKGCASFRPDYVVFAAAVLDFEPVRVRSGKVSSRAEWVLRLKPTPKIIDEVATRFPGIGRVGFKLEARPLAAGARDRLAKRLIQEKGLLALCLNFRSELKRGGHPAHLYSRGSIQRCTTKGQIAAQITRVLEQDWKK